MIILAYVLNLFGSIIQEREIFSDPRNYDLQETRNKMIKYVKERSKKVENLYRNPEKLTILDKEFSYENEILKKSNDESDKYFHSKPVRPIGFITEAQDQMLFTIVDTYFNLDKRIIGIKDENLRDTYTKIFVKLISFMDQVNDSKYLEIWRFLRVDRLLSKLNRLFELLEIIIFETQKYQDKKDYLVKLQEDLIFLEKNVINRLYK